MAQQRVVAAGLTAAQVQVVLNYHAVAHIKIPPQPWPGTPQDLQIYQESIARHLRAKYPNAVLSFWATPEYGGYATGQNNPEPHAHRSGYGVKWMIGRQIAGDADLNADPNAGPVVAPWMDWGPYTWADGMTPRGDGLFWEARDFQSDGTHPNRRGVLRLAGAWASLLRTSPLTAPWAIPAGNLPPLCDVISPENNMVTPIAGPVAIEAHAQDDDGHVTRVEFFVNESKIGEDHDAPYSVLWTPPGPGDHPVRVVAWDNDGASRSSATITARIRQPQAASDTLASDGFESGDFLGGTGWNGAQWNTGNALFTAVDAADGSYSARLENIASIARSLPLASTTGVTLDFAWKVNLPAGASFVAEIRDTDWRNVLVRNSSNAPAGWQSTSIDLGTYQPSSTFGVRFRTSGSGAAAWIDSARIRTSIANEVPALSKSFAPVDGGRFMLSWPTATMRTYLIEQSDDLVHWAPLLHTTAVEASTAGMLIPRAQERSFFRIQDLTPR